MYVTWSAGRVVSSAVLLGDAVGAESEHFGAAAYLLVVVLVPVSVQHIGGIRVFNRFR